MTREEFEQLMKDEQEKGTQVAGATLSRDQLTKMSVYLRRAATVLDSIKAMAAEQHDMELITDCMVGGEGIDMVIDLLLTPILGQAEKFCRKAEEPETPEEPEADE